MRPIYMPFTYLPESTARAFAALVGPVVVYQPLATAILPEMQALESQGLISLCSPITGDEERLAAALTEFAAWGQMNPGHTTAGADYLGARQGTVPFFDENTINRIRSDIRGYQQSKDDAEPDPLAFTARLFLALCQANDQTVDQLGSDIDRFQRMETDFQESFPDAGKAGFNRRRADGFGWRKDPGTRLTGQRMRAWAALAAADNPASDLLITTSRAVVDALIETHGECPASPPATVAIPEATGAPLLLPVLAQIAEGRLLLEKGLPAGELPFVDPGTPGAATLGCFRFDHCPTRLLGHAGQQPSKGQAQTLVVLVEA